MQMVEALFVKGVHSLPFIYGTILNRLLELTQARQDLKMFTERVKKAQENQTKKVLVH